MRQNPARLTPHPPRTLWPQTPIPPLSWGERLKLATLAILTLTAVGTLSGRILDGLGLLTLIASMGASSVIVFTAPGSPVAQPWPVFFGHVVSAAIGVAVASLIPTPHLAAGVAVGLAILAMFLTRSLHPPGGATALIPVLGGDLVQDMGWRFVLAPVALNALLLLALALLLNNLLTTHPYPARQVPAKPTTSPPEDRPVLERIGLQARDIRRALAEQDVFLDVSEADLGRVYDAAFLHAWRREFGEICCGQIMSHTTRTVEFATPLAEAWALLRDGGSRVLPVVDRARFILGIVTVEDFVTHASGQDAPTLGERLRRLLTASTTVTSAKPEVAGQIMSQAPTLPVNAHIGALVPLLTQSGQEHVLIRDDKGRLAGLIGQAELVATLYRGRLPTN